jgi:hypothetical protein
MESKWNEREYQLVIGVLRAVRRAPDGTDQTVYDGGAEYWIGEVEEEFISVFSADNSAFDVVKFRAAIEGRAE